MIEQVYGRHPVHHLLMAGRRKAHCLHALKSLENDALVLLARTKKVRLEFHDSNFFVKKLGSQATHQGFVCEAESYPYVGFEHLLQGNFILVLDQIQDPQNLGAICRSAHFFGVTGIVLQEKHAAGIGPGACQGSVGAVEYLSIARIPNLSSRFEDLKENGFWIYGLDMNGTKNMDEEKFPPKVALVVGNEEHGLRPLVRERCDILLRIPEFQNNIGSLNASVAAAIGMYEVGKGMVKK